MQISEETIAMCRLVSFVEREGKYAQSVKFAPEGYAEDVLKRFREEISPDAVLVFGDKVMDEHFDYVQCSIDGTWVFGVGSPFMVVAARTDGSIDLDEGTAEGIFNFVSD